MRLLIVTAVSTEAEALGEVPDAHIVVSGVGRTNAAAATTLASIAHGPFDAAISIGLAGALPESQLEPGDLIAADQCVYAEEGIMTPEGFLDITGLGFQLGADPGNAISCDEDLVRRLQAVAPIMSIATVATCSGTDAAAAEIRNRTGCAAEAMEGAAVVHAAQRLNIPAIEVRAISNTTGDRHEQRWDLPKALQVLQEGISSIRNTLR
ncbi:MAG: futalosine hydrolase [Phycisphaerales bacterium]|nr:futalosine hydrolase [Phycisphaerales bacterium]